jgi:hypothetical protein
MSRSDKMSNRRSYDQEAFDMLDRAMRSSGLSRSCLMEEALRLHRLSREGCEARSSTSPTRERAGAWTDG